MKNKVSIFQSGAILIYLAEKVENFMIRIIKILINQWLNGSNG